MNILTKDKQGIVLSTSLSGQTDENVQFVGGDLQEFISILRQSPGSDIWLVGGSKTIHDFMKHGFVDELILSIHPIILGDGIPLIVKDPSLETALELQDVKNYNSGLLQVTYQVKSKRNFSDIE